MGHGTCHKSQEPGYIPTGTHAPLVPGRILQLTTWVWRGATRTHYSWIVGGECGPMSPAGPDPCVFMMSMSRTFKDQLGLVEFAGGKR